MLLFSYGLILLAFVAGTGEGTEVLGATLGVGLGLIPMVFAVAAFGSGTSPALPAVLKATGLFALVAIPIAAYDLVTGMVAGFGAGGVVALRLQEGRSRRPRVIAVALVALYTFALLRVSAAAAIFGGAVLPFIAITFADEFGARRNAEPEE